MLTDTSLESELSIVTKSLEKRNTSLDNEQKLEIRRKF